MKPLVGAMFLSLALGACSPPQAAAPVAGHCAGDGQPAAQQSCEIKTDAATYRVTFGPAPEGGKGAVAIDVLADHDDVGQSLKEAGVSAYSYPRLGDVDGDGREDFLIARDGGAANQTLAFWRQNESGAFVRLGEVSGVTVSKTADGFLAVPARSSAAEWVIGFYRVDEAALTKLAAVTVKAEKTNEAGAVVDSSCALTDDSGVDALDLTDKAAETKFCAEPSAQVFKD